MESCSAESPSQTGVGQSKSHSLPRHWSTVGLTAGGQTARQMGTPGNDLNSHPPFSLGGSREVGEEGTRGARLENGCGCETPAASA